MDDLQEAVQTITKMSPPMLIVLGAAIINFMLKPFLPERFLWPIATISGGAVAPYLIPHGSLAYDVPSPGTALVVIGAIMGFVGSVIHRRFGRWLEARRESTQNAASPSRLDQLPHPDSQRMPD
jgi:hypothetical protein